jgi:hypothetical protein
MLFQQAALYIAENQQQNTSWPEVVMLIAMMAFGSFLFWLMTKD